MERAKLALTPGQQSYLMQCAPDTADIQLSLSSSVLHMGIATGSVVGGIVIEKSAVTYNAWVGCSIVLVALVVAVYSLTRPFHGKAAAAHQASAGASAPLAES